MNTCLQIRIVSLVLVLLQVYDIKAQSQSPSTERYGIYGGYNINFHSADFRALPGVPNCCPKFESGSGSGFALGALFEMSVSRKFWFTFQAGYSTLNATLNRQEFVPALRVSDDYYFPDAAINHQIKAQLSTFSFAPLLTFNPIGGFRLHAGMELASLGAVRYDQIEEMTVEGLVFKENLKRTRNEFSGNLTEINKVQTSLLFGLSMELPLNRSRSMLLAPEAMFHIGLSNITENVVWKANSFRIGLSLKYAPQESPDTSIKLENQAPPAINQPSSIVEKKLPQVNKTPTTPILTVKTFGVSEKGEQFPLQKIRIEEFISTQLKPLLPYIFFENNSSVIPSRYKKISANEHSSFSLNETAHAPTLQVYYQMLNIIGKRMSEHSDAILKLTGCNADVSEERGQKSLSTKRVEEVKNYLVSVWNISSRRIKTEIRNLPLNPSHTSDEDVSSADEENRRVEFSSDNSQILAPVISQDTIRSAFPQNIRFVSSSSKDWSVNLLSKGIILSKISSTSETIEWHPADYAGTIGETVEVSGISDGWIPAQESIPVELLTLRRKKDEQIADKTVDKYSLIVFDFDRSDLSPQNKKIAEYVKKSLSSTSKVLITGTTDKLGDATYNRKLSLERARATANALGIQDAELLGEGKKEMFQNSLPEGRFYNRTVIITVETPK